MVFTRSMGRQLRSQKKPIVMHVTEKKTKKKKSIPQNPSSKVDIVNRRITRSMAKTMKNPSETPVSENKTKKKKRSRSSSNEEDLGSFDHESISPNKSIKENIFSQEENKSKKMDLKNNGEGTNIDDAGDDKETSTPRNNSNSSSRDSIIEVPQNLSSSVILPDGFDLGPKNGNWKIIGRRLKKNWSSGQLLSTLVINNKKYSYYCNRDYKRGEVVKIAVPSKLNNKPTLYPLYDHSAKTVEERKTYKYKWLTLDNDLSKGKKFQITSKNGEKLTFKVASDMKKGETIYFKVPPNFEEGIERTVDFDSESSVGEYNDQDEPPQEVKQESSPTKKKSRDSESSVENIYENMPAKYTKEPNNPNFEKHLIKIPFRMLIAGGSGSGKTVTLFNIFKKFKGTFKEVHIVVANQNEALYDFLMDPDQEEFGKGYHIHEGLAKAPNVDDFEADGEQKLVVFDDLVLEKDQKKIEEYFVRGRKKGVSTVYLSQRYYGTPILIRQNLTHIILKRNLGNKDLKNILSNFALGITKEVIMQRLYNDATTRVQDFLLIDLTASQKDKFRKNFRHIYDVRTGKTHEVIEDLALEDDNKKTRKSSQKSLENNKSQKKSAKAINDRISINMDGEDFNDGDDFNDGEDFNDRNVESYPLEERGTYRHRTKRNPNGCSKKYIIYKHNKHDCRPVLREVDLETNTIVHNGRIYPLNSIKGKFRYADKKPLENIDGTINDADE